MVTGTLAAWSEARRLKLRGSATSMSLATAIFEAPELDSSMLEGGILEGGMFEAKLCETLSGDPSSGGAPSEAASRDPAPLPDAFAALPVSGISPAIAAIISDGLGSATPETVAVATVESFGSSCAV
jgi:hypothetical protein